MNIFLKSKALIAGFALLSMAAGGAAHAGETLELNKTQILRLSQPAASVIIGNPNIADVSVQSDTTLFLMGRGYGETNIMILDQYDNILMDSVITVIAPQNEKQVNLILGGMGSQTYHCAPYCQPSPQLGNINTFIAGGTAQGGGAANGTANLAVTAEDSSGAMGGSGDSTASGAPAGGVDAGQTR